MTTPIHFYGSRMRDAGPLAPNLTEEEIQANADKILAGILAKPTGYDGKMFYRDAEVRSMGYEYRSNEVIRILVKPAWDSWRTRYVLVDDPAKISEIVAELDPSDEDEGYLTRWIFFPPEDQVYEAC